MKSAKSAMSRSQLRRINGLAAATAMVSVIALSSPPAGATLSVYTFVDPGGGAPKYGTELVTAASGPLEATVSGAYAYANDVQTLTLAPLTLKAYASAGGANYANSNVEARVQTTVLFNAENAAAGDIVSITWGFLFDGAASAWATPRASSTDPFPYGFAQGSATAYLMDGSTNIARFDAWAEAESYDSNFGVLTDLRYDLGYYDLLDFNNFKEAGSTSSASFDTATAFGIGNNGLTLQLVNGRTYTVDYELWAEGGGTIGAGGTLDFANTLIGTFAAAPDCTNCSGLEIYIGGVLYEPPVSVPAPAPPTFALLGAALGALLTPRFRARLRRS